MDSLLLSIIMADDCQITLLCEILDVYCVTCRSYCDYCICYLFYHSPAVFKLWSATGSHGVRERIPKSSNCLHGF